MKCSTHQTVDAIANCSKCNTPLCGECIVSKEGDAPMCVRCIALSAVADFGTAEAAKSERRKQVEVDKETRGGSRIKIQVAIIAIALIIVPIQFYNLFKGPGPYVIDETDQYEVTDFCILNLWEISDQLQQGILPGKEFRCPIHGQEYIVTHTGENIIVSDPNPELHDYVEFSVSKDDPIPLLY